MPRRYRAHRVPAATILAAFGHDLSRHGRPRPCCADAYRTPVRQLGVNQRQIRAFAELDFVPKAENIVFIGPTGSAKRTGRTCGREANARRPSVPSQKKIA
jgi:hypothetical protein